VYINYASKGWKIDTFKDVVKNGKSEDLKQTYDGHIKSSEKRKEATDQKAGDFIFDHFKKELEGRLEKLKGLSKESKDYKESLEALKRDYKDVQRTNDSYKNDELERIINEQEQAASNAQGVLPNANGNSGTSSAADTTADPTNSRSGGNGEVVSNEMKVVERIFKDSRLTEQQNEEFREMISKQTGEKLEGEINWSAIENRLKKYPTIVSDVKRTLEKFDRDNGKSTSTYKIGPGSIVMYGALAVLTVFAIYYLFFGKSNSETEEVV